MHHDPNRPTVSQVLPLVRDLYNEERECTLGSGNVGGHLHIVLDDENLESHHVASCLEDARKDRCEICIEIGEKMVRMSPTQRRRIHREH